MAIFKSDHMDRGILRQQFERASARGQYLMLISEGTNDVYAVHRSERTITANDANDAFEQLKFRYQESRAWDGSMSVLTVFEPGKNYKDCFDTKPEESGLGQAVQHFDTYVKKQDLEQQLTRMQKRGLWQRIMNR